MNYFLLVILIILGVGVFVTLIWMITLYFLEKKDKEIHKYSINFPNPNPNFLDYISSQDP
jgi:hypothetical protein